MMDEFYFSEMVSKSRVAIKTGMTQVSLLDEGPPSDAPPITKRDEEFMMRALMNDSAFANLLMRTLSLNEDGVHYALGVRHPIVFKNDMVPGDIDLLCGYDDRPHHAVAVEAKQMRAFASDSSDDVLKRVHKILGGIRQANGLRELGFHRSYYLVLVATDGREKPANNVLARGVQGRTITAIASSVLAESGKQALHEDVGLVVLELVQPAPRAFDELSNVTATVLRMARPLDQPAHLTNRVAQALGAAR